MMNRREFIQWGTLSLCLTSGCSPSARGGLSFSAATKGQQHYITAFDGDKRLLFETKVDQRCHGGSYNPITKETAWAARSPGNKLYILNHSGTLINQIESKQGRHFYGHSQYSFDGKWLYTTENDFINAKGVISVRSVDNNYQLVNEFDSGGIGPHEFFWLSDGIHLAIANGGLQTRPDSKKTLNLESMQPSLVILNSQTGNIIKQLYLPDPLLSIRHLSVANNNQIIILTQYKGAKDTEIPLIYSWQPGQNTLQALNPPKQGWLSLKQYTASACISTDGVVAISSPRGKQIGFWNIETREFLQSFRIRDVAGISYDPVENRFIASNGEGQLRAINATTLEMMWLSPIEFSDTAFDNHMLFTPSIL